RDGRDVMGVPSELLALRRGENFTLHERYLNAQMVRVLRAIGYDRRYVKARGPYLVDEDGNEYLDLLSGFGVFALGRNHPRVVAALQDVLAHDLPDLVQLDVSPLSGLLAERIVNLSPPGIDRVFFCNSGAEAVEAAVKFGPYATRRETIVYCEHGFHGLTTGAVSLNREPILRPRLEPLLPACASVPLDDL